MISRQRQTWAFAAIVAVVLVTGVDFRATTARPHSFASPPRTLVETRGPIVGLAQDTGYLAWVTGDLDCLDAVQSRPVSRGPPVTLDTFTDVCYASQVSPVPIAVARRRVLWAAFDIGGINGYGDVWVGEAGRKPVSVQSMIWDYQEHGEFVTDAAGDGATLVYATAEATHNYGDDQDACDAAADCRYAVTGGGVFRVAGARRVRVPSAPPALMLAVSGRRVALVPASRTRTAETPYGVLEPANDGPVEVRDALTGALASRFSPRGQILALGLSDRLVAVLVSRGQRQVEIRDVRTGRLTRSVVVPTADELGLSGATVVLRAGSALYVLNARAGEVRRVAVAKTPVGVSIEGRRVVWAENISEASARIRVIELD